MRPPLKKSNRRRLIHIKEAGLIFTHGYNALTGCPSQTIRSSTGIGLATK